MNFLLCGLDIESVHQGLLLVRLDDPIVTECFTSDIFSMLLCGVSDCIIVFSIVLAP